MIKDYAKFVAHLKRTGREKLLPQILRELKAQSVLEAKRAPRTETAKENPSLLSGKRILKDGTLTDTTGKRALLEIYQKVIG